MGIDYTQYCLVGVRVNIQDINVVVKEAVYEDQNRYDTKTGKITHVEKVLVKSQVSKFVFNNKEYENIYNIENDYKNMTFLYNYDESAFYLGIPVKEPNSYGSFHSLTGFFLKEEILELFEEASKKLNRPVQMHFISSVG